jgi:hypothetical protein
MYLEQLISDLIVAINHNTAAIKAASNMTVTTSGTATVTNITSVDASTEPEKKATTRKPKADTPKAPEPTPAPAPAVVPEPVKKSYTLEEVRGLGQEILDLTGDTTVIREYVAKVLPNEAKPALRLLQPEQFEDAQKFLTGVIAKLDQKIVEEYRAKKGAQQKAA